MHVFIDGFRTITASFYKALHKAFKLGFQYTKAWWTYFLSIVLHQ
jgi:hypothetical protein